MKFCMNVFVGRKTTERTPSQASSSDRTRTRFSDFQLAGLDLAYMKSQNPSRTVMEGLCSSFDLELSQVNT